MSVRGVLALAALALTCAACGGAANRAANVPPGSTSPQAGHGAPSASRGGHTNSSTRKRPGPRAGRGRAGTRHTNAVAPRPPVIVGIGDNRPGFLTDPRFLALGVTHVRDDVPWDILREPLALARLTVWLDDARREHLTALISFDHSGINGRRRTLPTTATFAAAFRAFRARFPWVTEFVTWDEANFFLEPTARQPGRVAAYYLALRRDCSSCTILATDLLDLSGRRFAVPMIEWAREFLRYLPAQPAYWGLNNYVGANALSSASTISLLRLVTGKIWFAETAGVISDGGHAVEATAARLQRQAAVDRYIVGQLAAVSPRIERVYLYEWNAQSRRDTWDSALISPDGVPRPAYHAVANLLASWGMRALCLQARADATCRAG